MAMLPVSFYGDGTLTKFPCPFPGGAGVVTVDGAVTAFTQGVGTITFGSAPTAGALIVINPVAADVGAPAIKRIAGVTGAPAAVVVKGAPGILSHLLVSNKNAADLYVKFYDTAGTVTVGTTTPAFTVRVKAGESLNLSYLLDPLVFKNGIQFALTKLVADSDTTALDAAGDLTGFIKYL